MFDTKLNSNNIIQVVNMYAMPVPRGPVPLLK